MARNLSSIAKQSRREGYALHPKAHKILIRRASTPGQSGGFRHPHTKSQYQIQLREKQKVKRLYGLLEKQFSKLMKEATRSQGQSGEALLKYLEQRIDNVIYRSGFAPSRRAARQLVSHGHFLLNGKRVDIPSIRLKINDHINPREHSLNTKYFKNINEISSPPQSIPSWLKVNRNKFDITIVGEPTRDDAELDINEQLIIEYYSR